MEKTLHPGNIFSGLFAIVLVIIGVLNLVFIHPVPGMMYILIAFLYVPMVNVIIRKNLGFSIHYLIKIALGIALMMFTLGVSDLGDMLDKL